jgi:hypothetical protein
MKPLTLWLLFSSAIGPLVQADRPAILFDLTPFDEHKMPPYPGFTVESWVGGYDPQFCHDVSQRARHGDDDPRKFCEVEQIEVFNITYADCDRPWILCRCPEAEAVRAYRPLSL